MKPTSSPEEPWERDPRAKAEAEAEAGDGDRDRAGDADGNGSRTRLPGPRHAVGFFFFLILVTLLAFLVLGIVLGALDIPLDTDSQMGSALLIGIQALINLGAALLFASLGRFPYREVFRLRPAPGEAYLWGPVGMIALGVVVAQLAALLLRAVPELASENLQEMVRLSRYTSLGSFLVYALVISVGPGISEELAFRGLILSGFASRYSAPAAMALSAVLFALMHVDPLHILATFPAGLWLGWLVLRTGSLYPAVVAHALNNLWSTLEAAYRQVEPGVEPSDVLMELYPWPAVLLAAGVLLLAIHRLRGLKGPAG